MSVYRMLQPLTEYGERLRQAGERRFRTDFSYLARGGAWLTFEQVAVAAIALLLSIAFANLISKETYGTYRFLLSIFWILTAFTLTGLPTIVARAVARGHEGAYRKGLTLSIRWGLPLCIIGLGGAGYYAYAGNMLLAEGLAAIALLGPFFQAAYLYGSFLEGKLDFKRTALYGIALAAFPALALFGALLVITSPIVFLIVYLGANLAVGGILTVLLFVNYRPNREGDPELMRLSGHFSVMNLLSTAAQQLDQIVVFHYLGAAELAVYSFAVAMPEQIKSMSTNISTLAFPKFANRSKQEIRENFWGRFWGLAGVFFLVALAYILVAPLAFHFLFPKYLDAVLYSQVYAVSLVIVGNAIPLSVLQAHAAKEELYAFNVASPVVQIVLLIALTAVYGLWGTILARIAGRVFNLVLSSILVNRFFRRT